MAALRSKERLRWLARTALAAFILAAVGFLSAVTAIRLAIQGREVQVPNLVGRKTDEAERLLAQARLGLRVSDRTYSDLPADHILRQSPPPGTTVKAGQRVHVALSLGPRKVTTPLVEGKSLRAARVELLRAGLELGEVSSCHLPQERDHVVQQDPRPETPGASPRVNLLVSLGEPEPAYVMPDLAGLTPGEVQRRLAAAGLRLAKITFVPRAEAPRGTVIGQTPASGSRVVAGSAVEVEVAAEPSPGAVLE